MKRIALTLVYIVIIASVLAGCSKKQSAIDTRNMVAMASPEEIAEATAPAPTEKEALPEPADLPEPGPGASQDELERYNELVVKPNLERMKRAEESRQAGLPPMVPGEIMGGSARPNSVNVISFRYRLEPVNKRGEDGSVAQLDHLVIEVKLRNDTLSSVKAVRAFIAANRHHFPDGRDLSRRWEWRTPLRPGETREFRQDLGEIFVPDLYEVSIEITSFEPA